MEHTCDGIRWRHQYQNGKIWLNGDWIAINSQERVLSIIINSFQSSILCQKRCLSETEICHYSKTLIWRRWFPLQFDVMLVLSFEYYIQSIKVYHVSKKHSKCPIWIIGDIFKISDVIWWRHNYVKSIALLIIYSTSLKLQFGVLIFIIGWLTALK